MLTKALRGLKITDTAERRVEAVFATFDVKDHDGDVTLKGAFTEDAPVRISAYNHASWAPGQLPAGKGKIRVSGDDAILDGQFFDTTVGNDTFETVKQMGDLQEWSYGYDAEDAEPGQFKGERVRFLKALLVHEVSPVLLGAGIDTRTLSAKGRATGRCKECGGAATPLFDGQGDLKALVCRCGHVERKQLDSDLEGELIEAAVGRWGNSDTWIYLYDHDVDENFAVFSVCTWDDSDLLKVAFTRGQDGGVTLASDVQAVDAVISFVPDRDTGSEPEADDAEVKSDAERPDGAKGDGDVDPGAASPQDAPSAVKDDQAEGGRKLADQIAAVEHSLDELTNRLADATAQRVKQDGRGLSDATVDRVEQLAASAERLREAVAIEPPKEADAASAEDAKRLTLEDETQLADLERRFGSVARSS